MPPFSSMPPLGVLHLLMVCLIVPAYSALVPVCGELASSMATLPMTSTFQQTQYQIGQRFEVTYAVTVANFTAYLYGISTHSL
jgi:hypothetical protein